MYLIHIIIINQDVSHPYYYLFRCTSSILLLLIKMYLIHIIIINQDIFH